MNRLEFEKKVRKLGIVGIDNIPKKINSEEKYFYQDPKSNDVYGFYKSKENKYVIFYKAGERSLSKIIGEFKTAEEAWNELYNDIKI